MNNSNVNRLCGICPTCRRLIGVDPRNQYEKCAFCQQPFNTRYAIDFYNNTKRNNLNNNINTQNNNYQRSNIPNQTAFQNPVRSHVQGHNGNAATWNKRLGEKIIIIIAICVLLIIIVVALFSSYAEKQNTQKRIAEKGSALSLHEGEIQMTESYTDFVGKNYTDVVRRLNNYGFTNVKTVEKETTNINDDNKVESVFIDGVNMFKTGNWYSPDVTIQVRYNKMTVITTVTTTKVTTTAKPVEATTVIVTEAPVQTQPQGITPEFKQMMDNYEAFFDEYISFMERLSNDSDSDDFAALGDYFSMLEKEAKMMQEMEAIDDKELSDADYAYYIEVTSRIYQKLMKVTFSLF